MRSVPEKRFYPGNSYGICNSQSIGSCKIITMWVDFFLFCDSIVIRGKTKDIAGEDNMRTLGNILWFLFGGFLGGLAWIFAGCLWCITIVGIPVGLQCFKFASLAFWPFGKEIVYGNGTFSFLVNLIWILFFGWEMALGNLILGFFWCITIVGIPFGKQFFKMAKLSFMPFGASVIR